MTEATEETRNGLFDRALALLDRCCEIVPGDPATEQEYNAILDELEATVAQLKELRNAHE